jgi:hypothetical protein
MVRSTTPAAWHQFEAFGAIGSFDNLDGPAADLGKRLFEFRTGLATIGEDMT